MQVESKHETEKDEFRHMVRLSGVILDGNLDLARTLTHIKGIGQRISLSLIGSLEMDPEVKLGSLNNEEIEKIEEGIKNIDKTTPPWMLNRQKDMLTGDNLHLTGSDLDMSNREDINLQKRIKSYRGIRHSLKLPVRGQRTRTSFRKGSTVGVKRKKGR